MGVLVPRRFGEKIGFEVSWDGRVYKEKLFESILNIISHWENAN